MSSFGTEADASDGSKYMAKSGDALTEYEYSDYNWGDDTAEQDTDISFETQNESFVDTSFKSKASTLETSSHPSNELDSSELKENATDIASQDSSIELHKEQKLGIDASPKPAKTPKVISDPLASLHAALGIQASETAMPLESEQVKSDKVYDRVIEAELEESQDFESESLLEDNITFDDDFDSQEQELFVEPASDFASSFAEASIDESKKSPDEKTFSVSESLEKAEADFEKNYQKPTLEKVAEKDTQTVDSGFLVNNIPLDDADADEWTLLVKELGLQGSLLQIAQSSTMARLDDDKLSLVVSPSQDMLCTDSAKAGIEKALLQYFDKRLSFVWSFAEPEMETPAQYWRRKAEQKHQEACKIVAQAPFCQQLVEKFKAELDFSSVEYIEMSS